MSEFAFVGLFFCRFLGSFKIGSLAFNLPAFLTAAMEERKSPPEKSAKTINQKNEYQKKKN